MTEYIKIVFWQDGRRFWCEEHDPLILKSVGRLMNMKENQLQEQEKNGELQELKRELLKEIDVLAREHKSFKKRISLIANFFIPGIGFFIYGKSFLQGLITFVLFTAYNLLYFLKILPDIGDLLMLYYMPAIAIWFVSLLMVARLDE